MFGSPARLPLLRAAMALVAVCAVPAGAGTAHASILRLDLVSTGSAGPADAGANAP